MLVLRGVMWSFYFPHGKHIRAIWWHGISTNSGDSYGHQLCSTYSRFIFILLREGLYVWPSKVETFDLIDMFNDTSRYLDDISPSITLNLRNIFLIYIQLNFSWIKQILQTEETSFLDLNIKVIGSDIHTSVYDKRDDFGFPIVNFPWLSGDVPRLHHTYLHFAVG